MADAPLDQRATPSASRWAVWRDRIIEAVIIVFFWAYAWWSGFEFVSLIPAIVVTWWIPGMHFWKVLRGEDGRPPASGLPSDRWTTGEIARMLVEPVLLAGYWWVVAMQEGIQSGWGVFALIWTAAVALVFVNQIREGPNPPEPEFKGSIHEIPLHHDDPNVRHEFPRT